MVGPGIGRPSPPIILIVELTVPCCLRLSIFWSKLAVAVVEKPPTLASMLRLEFSWYEDWSILRSATSSPPIWTCEMYESPHFE